MFNGAEKGKGPGMMEFFRIMKRSKSDMGSTRGGPFLAGAMGIAGFGEGVCAQAARPPVFSGARFEGPAPPVPEILPPLSISVFL